MKPLAFSASFFSVFTFSLSVSLILGDIFTSILGFHLFKKIILPLTFLFLWSYLYFGCAGSSLLCKLFSSCGKQRLLSVLSAWASHGSGLYCCGAGARGCVGFSHWSVGSVAVAQGLSCFVACGTFPDRNQTQVSCIGRQILYHWASREAC